MKNAGKASSTVDEAIHAADDIVDKTDEVADALTDSAIKNGDEVADGAGVVDDAVEGGSKTNLEEFDISKLSRSQQKAIESARNNINDHLKESDLSGALMELQGNPIPKADGGYWNHIQEVKDAYTGLVRAEGTLSGSLKNPNLASDVREFIQGEYDIIKFYIQTIEDLFAPYGGIN